MTVAGVFGSPSPPKPGSTLSPLSLHAAHIHTMPRILLLPVDDTDDAERATAFVLADVARPGDELHFFVVVSGTHPTYVPGADVVADAPETAAERAATNAGAADFMERRFGARCVAAGVAYKLEVGRYGPTDAAAIGDAVAKRADELGAALVAIASHAKGRLARWLQGSVTHEVAARARVPVLLVQ